MAYKRILTIQDISCIGQCSMTVALPVLSACGHETCILPTAVLSTHTGGFGKPVVHHLSGDMKAMADHWQSQNITFDAILVGYLGSIQAVEAAMEIADTLRASGGLLIVDPAFGDHGKLYSGFDLEYVQAMKGLCGKADILLPNLTEAAVLAGIEFKENYTPKEVELLLKSLGTRQVVLTGVGFAPGKTGAAIWSENGVSHYHHSRIGKNFHGTGDLFAACFTGALMQGKPLFDAVKLAADFTCRVIEKTCEAPAHWYGVKFERVLPWLVGELFG